MAGEVVIGWVVAALVLLAGAAAAFWAWRRRSAPDAAPPPPPAGLPPEPLPSPAELDAGRQAQQDAVDRWGKETDPGNALRDRFRRKP